MHDPDRRRTVDHEKAEDEAQAALDFRARERGRESTKARELVSEKEALEDAWANSDERYARDEGW